jgi:transposase
VHGLLADGRGLREIARHLGWGLHTVQRYARAASWQELADGRWQQPRRSKLDPFKSYLDQHADDERPRLKAILERCPELRVASDQVRAFAVMTAQLTGQNLPQWISDARAVGLPGISSFANGLEQDLDAVTQGLTTRWNSGPVEGRVNRIKMIKRQMFGRAGLPLLRKRVLLTAQNKPATQAASITK